MELSEDISFSISSGGFEVISNLFFVTHCGLSGEEIGEFINLSSVSDRSSGVFFDDVVIVRNTGF
jgi:hypothetical protein